jgi:hypothetical protein
MVRSNTLLMLTAGTILKIFGCSQNLGTLKENIKYVGNYKTYDTATPSVRIRAGIATNEVEIIFLEPGGKIQVSENGATVTGDCKKLKKCECFSRPFSVAGSLYQSGIVIKSQTLNDSAGNEIVFSGFGTLQNDTLNIVFSGIGTNDSSKQTFFFKKDFSGKRVRRRRFS